MKILFNNASLKKDKNIKVLMVIMFFVMAFFIVFSFSPAYAEAGVDESADSVLPDDTELTAPESVEEFAKEIKNDARSYFHCFCQGFSKSKFLYLYWKKHHIKSVFPGHIPLQRIPTVNMFGI